MKAARYHLVCLLVCVLASCTPPPEPAVADRVRPDLTAALSVTEPKTDTPAPPPSFTPTVAPSATWTPELTPFATVTLSPSQTPTATATPTASPSPTATAPAKPAGMVQFEGFAAVDEGDRWVQKDVDGKVIFHWDQAKNEGKGSWVIDESVEELDGTKHKGALSPISIEVAASTFLHPGEDSLILPIDITGGGRIEETKSARDLLAFVDLPVGAVVISPVAGIGSIVAKTPTRSKTVVSYGYSVEAKDGFELRLTFPSEKQVLQKGSNVAIGTKILTIGLPLHNQPDELFDDKQLIMGGGSGLTLATIATDNAGHLLFIVP